VTELDRTDLKTALAAAHYYVRAFALIKRPVPEAAIRLINRLECALAASGHPKRVNPEQWLTTTQFAKQRGCSTRHARRIAQTIGHRIGNHWFIQADAPEQKEPNG
jgi:hypothetical protein